MKTYGEVEGELHYSQQVDVSGQLQAPDALPLAKQPRVPNVPEGGWASEPVWQLWRREKFLVPLWTRSWDSAVGTANGCRLDGRAVAV
jgi:hypothetical protein